MEKKTYYILLRDLEDPSNQSSAGMLWGMLSNYVYGTQPPLALKGELFESLPAADKKTAGVEDKVTVRGLKQKCLQVECPKEDLQVISDKDIQLLLAVQSYYQRCRLQKERQDLLKWAVADNEGCCVSVWMDDLKRDVPALVHYKGALPPYDGIMFGVEIVDPRFRNRGTTDGVFRCQRYFRCAPGAGMFVSLDKITILVAEKELNIKTEETNQDDYTHIENDEKPSEEDSGMESSGHSLVEAELLEEKSRALILENNTIENTEKNEKEQKPGSKCLFSEETPYEGEVVDFQQLYLSEKQLRHEVQLQMEESKLKISSLEKHLDEERTAREKLIEKYDALQKDLSQQALLVTDAELKIQEEQNKSRKMQKCFEREWEEFERRLIEERAAKSEAEQQLSALMRQLEDERNSKIVMQRELDTLQERLSQQQEEFEKQRRYGEVSLIQSGNMHENKTQPELESSDWIISQSEVEIIEERALGTGGWGVVKEGKFRGCKVAVKQIHELILSPHNRRLFVREMNIASRCRHPCLLQFIGATNDDGIPLFVTELMDASLRDLIEKKPLPKADVVSIALDTARALNYLHLSSPPIIHRDISSANVLLWRRDNQWRAKVSDYGTANFMRQCKTINPGSVIYSAPEAISTEQSPKIDVFSFGLLLCEMCIRELPVPRQTEEQISMIADQALRDLVTSCVRQEPGERPRMAEVITVLEKMEVGC